MYLTGTLRMGFVLLVAGAAGCGGDDGPTDEGAGSRDGGSNGRDTDAGNLPPGEVEETYPLDQTFWHQGFRVELGDAVYAVTAPDLFDERDYTVTIDAAFTNEGVDQSRLSSPVNLTTSSNAYRAGGDSTIPSPPGGVTLTGEFVFRVDASFAIDDAYLIVGDGDVQQARVPVGANGGSLVALEPRAIAVTGTLSTSLVDLNFRSGELRADDPVNHRQVDAGMLALTLRFDALSRKPGNWLIFAQEFSLTVPSGPSVAPVGSYLPGLVGSDAGVDTLDLFVRFEVDDPATGNYVLHFLPSNRWRDDAEPADLTMEITVN